MLCCALVVVVLYLSIVIQELKHGKNLYLISKYYITCLFHTQSHRTGQPLSKRKKNHSCMSLTLTAICRRNCRAYDILRYQYIECFIFPFQVLSKEQIMAYGTKAAKTFTLTAENSWAPSACILVFYVDELGVVVNDAFTVPIQPVLDNKVTILNLSLRPCFCLFVAW